MASILTVYEYFELAEADFKSGHWPSDCQEDDFSEFDHGLETGIALAQELIEQDNDLSDLLYAPVPFFAYGLRL